MFLQTSLLNSTQLYRLGNPFPTRAVILDLEQAQYEKCSRLPYLDWSQNNHHFVLEYDLADEDKVLGLGETMGGINKRGKKYSLYNTDDPLHTEEKLSLYSTHPFLMLKGKKSWALFIDYPGEMIFDIGFTDPAKLVITITGSDFDLYFFNTPDLKEMIQEYLQLTGSPYVPPQWAFGFQQSRWSYPDQNAVTKLADTFRQEKIPCDTIYIDIDHMENYKVFTVDQEKFPRLRELTDRLKEQGFKLISIVDPGVRVEKDYPVYEQGIKEGHFCTDKEGRPFETAVWPGLVHLPDFMNKKTRQWWGNMYQPLIEKGVAGFWNDMNEPTTFYTPREFENIQQQFSESNPRTFKNCWQFFNLRDQVNQLLNKREYYQQFYHKTDSGQLICHHDIHNIYGYQMALAFTEYFTQKHAGQRYFLLSRSSYAGMHRLAAIWSGDNYSWWEHLQLNIKMLINLNLCGFFYTGADIGGFGSDASSQLAIRWMQMAVFSPLFRNHSAVGSRHQEPFAYDEQTKIIIRNALWLRYALLPYLYSEFMRSVSELSPFIAYLPLHFGDEFALEIEDQFMVGRSVMAAPVYQANARGRAVYLPENHWLYWRAKTYDEQKVKILPPGHHYLDCRLDEVPILIKQNSLLVLTEPCNYIGEAAVQKLIVIGFVTEQAAFTYYEDDGITTQYQAGQYSTIEIKVERKNGSYQTGFLTRENKNVPLAVDTLHFKLFDETGRCVEEIKKIK